MSPSVLSKVCEVHGLQLLLVALECFAVVPLVQVSLPACLCWGGWWVL